jgi:hypothetical protein
MSYVWIAAVFSPFVGLIYWNKTKQTENFREIHREFSDAIGMNLPGIYEFEHRELTKQLAWGRRPWKQLFQAPPQIDYNGRY